ncbi:hypothetical protein, variant [Sphaeroforma arctica JP610]|uniref:Uncharacterized protein n=1 Tax=Sphaeroforma arctica JP610 TaxID=667725 RepID=A0A0L0GA33_9EUKA|nr:hypothetical protein, variant [Sphaeroforma arctica JP610]KNC85093.1 hypothetical protein, variant [Sphaeroforma arctica JP610]|eukprot:XP_014158996.1 hypothetical protein, variant [Sphaeroforma arctica JP610]
MTDSLFDELFANLSNEEMRERLEQYANQNYQLSIALGRVKQKLRLTEDHLIKTRDRVLDLQRENNALKIARKRTEDKNECLQASGLLTKRCLSMTETHLQSVLAMIERGLSADIEEQPEDPAPTAVLRHDRLKYDTRPHQRLSKAFVETSMTLSENEADDHLTDLPGDDYYDDQHIAAGANIQVPISSATHAPLVQAYSGEGSSGATRKTRNDDSFVFSQAISVSSPRPSEHEQTQARVHREHDHLEADTNMDMPLHGSLHGGNAALYGSEEMREDSDYEAYSRDIDGHNDSDSGSSCDSNESVSGDCDGEMDDMMRRAKKKGPLNDKRISAMSENMKSENSCMRDRGDRWSTAEHAEYSRSSAGAGLSSKGHNLGAGSEATVERKLSDPLPSSDAEEDEFHDRHAERDRYAYREQEASKNAVLKESLEAKRKSLDSWNATRRRRSCGSLGRLGAKRERPRRRQSGDFSGRGLSGSRALSQSDRFDAAVAMETDERKESEPVHTAVELDAHADGADAVTVNGSVSIGTGHSTADHDKHPESDHEKHAEGDHVRHGRNGRRTVHNSRVHEYKGVMDSAIENARRANVIVSDSESGVESEKEKERERAHKKKEEEKIRKDKDKARTEGEKKNKNTTNTGENTTNETDNTIREERNKGGQENSNTIAGDTTGKNAETGVEKSGNENHTTGMNGMAGDEEAVHTTKKVENETVKLAIENQNVIPAAADIVEAGNNAGSDLTTNDEDERGSDRGREEPKTSTSVTVPDTESMDVDAYSTLTLKQRLAQQQAISGNASVAPHKDHSSRSSRVLSNIGKTTHRLRRETPPPARPTLVEDEDDGKRRPRRSAAKRKSYVEPPLNKKLRRGMEHTFGTAPKSPTSKVKQKRASAENTENKNPSLVTVTTSAATHSEPSDDNRRNTTTNTHTHTDTQTNSGTRSTIEANVNEQVREGSEVTESDLVRQARASGPLRGGEKPAGKLKSAMVRGNRGGLTNRSPLGNLINLR